MRRAFVSVVLLLSAFLIAPASPASAAPYCGLVWGSLDETAGENALAGTVVFVRDLGELFECYMECGLEQHVVVAGSPRDRVAVEQGDRVWVRFPPEACVVVRA